MKRSRKPELPQQHPAKRMKSKNKKWSWADCAKHMGVSITVLKDFKNLSEEQQQLLEKYINGDS